MASTIRAAMESTPASADSAVEPAAIRPALPALPRLEARRRALIANTMLGGMVAAAFLMAAGGAAKHYGPTLHMHHGLPDSLRGPLHGIDLSMSGTEFGVVFILLGVCYLVVLAFADSVRVRVGLGDRPSPPDLRDRAAAALQRHLQLRRLCPA